MILPDPDLHLGNGDQDPIGYGLVPVPVPDPMITSNIIYFSSRSRIKKEIPGCEKLVLRIREHASAHLVYPNN